MKTQRLRSPQKIKKRDLTIGLLLIAASLFAVWWTIDSNDKTSEFLVAAAPASSGSEVSDSSFRSVRMNLGASSKLYVHPGNLPPGSYLLNTMAAGELVPRSAIATGIIDAREPVVITSKMPLPGQVKVGDLVDIWVSRLTIDNHFSQPVELVIRAEIVEIVQSSGVIGDSSQQVQVLVPSESVPPILDAIASKDALSLVLRRNLGND